MTRLPIMHIGDSTTISTSVFNRVSRGISPVQSIISNLIDSIYSGLKKR